MSELQQSSIVSKVKTNQAYTHAANYWAPLQETDENDEQNNNITAGEQIENDLRFMIRRWINQRIGNKPFQKIPSTMVLDSGATSHFVRPEENLPITGESHKVVHLPNGTLIKATHTTMLPFDSLSHSARVADVLPGLKTNTLISVGKLADANYTTVFHPQGNGVTVHEKGTFKLTQWRKPVLQGWRDGNGLWRISQNKQVTVERKQNKQVTVEQKNKEVAANVYNLPSISQTI